MISLVLPALFLPLSHFLIASTPWRGRLACRLGEERYLASYSALALVGLVWLVVAYLRAPTLALWATPTWVAAMLIPVALVCGILIAAGITTPNPVIVRQGYLVDRADIVRGILRVSRNSFFWGAGLLSLAQVIVLDTKKARQHGTAWRSFGAATSNVPFVAIIRGRAFVCARDRATENRIRRRRVSDHPCF